MATQAQIIGIRMDDQSTAHNVIRSGQGDVGVTDVHLELQPLKSIAVHHKKQNPIYRCNATGIWNNVSQVTGVTDSGIRATVLLAQGVEMGSSGHASIGVVSEFVDMESVASSG